MIWVYALQVTLFYVWLHSKGFSSRSLKILDRAKNSSNERCTGTAALIRGRHFSFTTVIAYGNYLYYTIFRSNGTRRPFRNSSSRFHSKTASTWFISQQPCTTWMSKRLKSCLKLLASGGAMFCTVGPEKSFIPKLAKILHTNGVEHVELGLVKKLWHRGGSCGNCSKEQLGIRRIMDAPKTKWEAGTLKWTFFAKSQKFFKNELIRCCLDLLLKNAN